MKTQILLSLCFFSAATAFASEAQVVKPSGRRPAFVEKVDPNQELFKRLKAGSYAILQNSVEEWNDLVVQVTDLFEDGSVRVLLPDGSRAFIRRSNLATSLSPAVNCKNSFSTDICVGDEVYYPNQAVTIGIPEGKVEGVFENGRVVIRDGLVRPYDITQVGKRVKCSPQKETVCVDDYVLGNGYRLNTPFTFEGPVERVYSHGIVVVRSSAFWRFPIDVSAVVERVATTENDVTGSVISSRSVADKLPARVTPEVEPRDADSLPVPRVSPAW
jgi:hypothetical protein